MFRDFVVETSTTIGTGTYSLDGPPDAGYRSFVAAAGAGGQTEFYIARNAAHDKFEIGWGVVTDSSPDTLTRNLLASSTGSLISWTAPDAPLEIYCAPIGIILESMLKSNRSTARPTWLPAWGMWIGDGTGATARTVSVFDGTNDILIGHVNETDNVFIPIGDVKAADLASAGTVNIAAAAGGYVSITGTTNITAFTTAAAGIERTLLFTGALKVTHNATSLILPGGRDIYTGAGTILVMRSEGSGNWRCVGYAPSLSADTRPVGSIDVWPTDELPPGWLARDGALVSRTTYAALFDVLVTRPGYAGETFTVTIASPAVVTKTAHGFTGGERVRLTTSGSLPTGLSANTEYFVIYVDANTFRLATTRENAAAGTAINTSGGQSGTHTYTRSLYGLGDGSTTFGLPDDRGLFVRGKAASGRGIGTYEADDNKAHTHDVSYQATPLAGGSGGGDINSSGTFKTTTSQGSEARPKNIAYVPMIKYN